MYVEVNYALSASTPELAFVGFQTGFPNCKLNLEMVSFGAHLSLQIWRMYVVYGESWKVVAIPVSVNFELRTDIKISFIAIDDC
jgi:hypothetical protein